MCQMVAIGKRGNVSNSGIWGGGGRENIPNWEGGGLRGGDRS